MESNNTENSLGLAPIVIGVTGHRDIPVIDESTLWDSALAFLRSIEARTPNSPHVLVSCLAEGADRIAAKCALSMGWVLGVVLPSPTDIYENDFISQQSKDDFHNLLRSAEWIEVAEGSKDGESDYLAAGVRLMQQSQLLIAFWDGQQNGLSGGTGDVVRIFMSEIPYSGKGFTGNNPPDARPVFHIMTRRKQEPMHVSQELFGRGEWIPPEPGGMASEGEIKRWEKILKQIDLFNLDAKKCYELNSAQVEESLTRLNGGKFDCRAMESAYKKRIGRMFALADSISINAQKEREKIFFILFCFTLIAIILEQINSNIYSSPLLLGMAVISGFIAVIVYRKGKSKRVEARYLDYRSLAEACRVQYFWQQAKIQSSVANNFLLEQRDELEWVRQAIRTNELSINVGFISKQKDIKQYEEILRNWIDDQKDYFIGKQGKNGAFERNEKQFQAWSQRAWVLFIAGITIVASIAVSKYFLVRNFNEIGELITQFASFSYGLLFALAGFIKVYQETKAFKEHSKSYRRSGLLMHRASQRLMVAIANNNIAEAERIIYETGCEALDENGDWLLLHRDRPVQVPLG